MWKYEEDASLLIASVPDNASVLLFHHTVVQLCAVVWNTEGLNWLGDDLSCPGAGRRCQCASADILQSRLDPSSPWCVYWLATALDDAAAGLDVGVHMNVALCD